MPRVSQRRSYFTFEKLYASPTGESWGVEGLDWSPISEESALRLDSPSLKKRFLRPFFSWIGTRLRGLMALLLQYSKTVGIQILDAVLIANEIVDERRRSGEKGVVFKIDFEKAYDHGGRVADLKSLLLVFGHISGLKPILYLGLPLGGNPKACGFWDLVIERISSRLDGWQKAYLSFGGRITLIQSCLTHMPCYFLSLFKLPASVAAKIERLQRDFLWSGIGEGKRDHLVRWDVVCKPKVIGGLGFENISLRNLALLGKWLWRYPREGSTSLASGHFKHLWFTLQWLGCLHFSKMVTSLSLEGYCTSLSGVFFVYLDFLSKFVWNSQVPFKVKSFGWLFQLAKMDWVPPRSISDMMSIKFKRSHVICGPTTVTLLPIANASALRCSARCLLVVEASATLMDVFCFFFQLLQGGTYNHLMATRVLVPLLRTVYHCPFCNLCRVGKGLGVDFFHCMTCNCCLAMKLADHKCREKGLETNCPICCDDMFSSSAVVRALPCGHFMHSACFQAYTCSHYICPICSKSLGDMAHRQLDMALN
ncbi:Zinc finger protein BRUTUS [Vitis vinifera]|uniref:Zinc finger protein BRUTUS n=1 Tax=Vitis vinifera TaxID=29760 RepID=A0A438ELE3_VITVI|nr:Zinc finger protein BRUTUS [Vitis vinifera]